MALSTEISQIAPSITHFSRRIYFRSTYFELYISEVLQMPLHNSFLLPLSPWHIAALTFVSL